MRKNYKVVGTVGFFVDEVLHTCLEYETSWQREQIIADFLDKVKKIRSKVIMWYIISVDEESIRIPPPKQARKKYPKEPKQQPIFRPKAEYSNTQFNDL